MITNIWGELYHRCSSLEPTAGFRLYKSSDDEASFPTLVVFPEEASDNICSIEEPLSLERIRREIWRRTPLADSIGPFPL